MSAACLIVAETRAFCPRVSANLTQDQVITLVISTFGGAHPLGLPQSFTTDGPGTFSSAPVTDSFVVTVGDGHGGTNARTVTVPITPPAIGGVV